ncbi:MAG: hypothetical protein ACYS1A_17740 [Planctomycetota bacterium]|jgi:hypothetical protein
MTNYFEMVYAARERLYYEARINDASRIFSWLRGDSKLTKRLYKELGEAAAKYKQQSEQERNNGKSEPV